MLFFLSICLSLVLSFLSQELSVSAWTLQRSGDANHLVSVTSLHTSPPSLDRRHLLPNLFQGLGGRTLKVVVKQVSNHFKQVSGRLKQVSDRTSCVDLQKYWNCFNSCSLRLLLHEFSPDNTVEFLKSTDLFSKM